MKANYRPAGRLLRLASSFPANLRSLLFSLVALGLVLPVATFDFDPVHDGVLLAPVIAVRDGLPIFSGVFSQYGPLPTYLSYIFLVIWPLSDATGIRVLGAFLIAITVFLILETGRLAPPSWSLSQPKAIVATAIWVILWDGFLGTPLHTWSSLFAIPILAGSILLLAVAERREKLDFRAFSAYAFAGVLIGQLLFVRQSVGIAALTLWLLLLVLALVLRIPVTRQLGVFALGTALSLAFPIVVLLFSGQLDGWITQNFLWPIEWASDRSDILGKIVRKFLPWTATPAILGVLIASVIRHRLGVRSLLVVVGVLLGSFRGALTGRGFGTLEYFPEVHSNDVAEAIWYFGHATATSFFFAAVTASVVVGLRELWRIVATREISFGTVAIVFASAAMLSQAVPVMESRHFWWGMIFPALALIDWLYPKQESGPSTSNLVLSLFVCLISITPTLTHAANMFLVDRTPLAGSPVFEGMKSRPSDADIIRLRAELVANMPADRTRIFLVTEGFWAVSRGDYAADDYRYVSWGSSLDLKERITGPTTILSDSREVTSQVERSLTGTQFVICEEIEAGGFQILHIDPGC